MAKYIKCDNCDGKIMFGDFMYVYDGCYAFCSARCFADYFAVQDQLNNRLATELEMEIYDTEDVRKRELELQISALQKELEILTVQN